jgi:hypothetical protein
MDMSKLPRLSQTNKGDAPEPVAGQPAVAPPPAPQADVRDYERRDPSDYDPGYSVGAEVWISVILGIVFMFMGFNFARFVGATLTGQPYHTGVNWTAGENEGKEVGYFDLQGGTAYTESGIFLFGLALVLEAAALLAAHAGAPGRRALVGLALSGTIRHSDGDGLQPVRRRDALHDGDHATDDDHRRRDRRVHGHVPVAALQGRRGDALIAMKKENHEVTKPRRKHEGKQSL